MASSIEINGLPLPRDLLALIEAGRWACPDDLSVVDRLFPLRGVFRLYPLDVIAAENEGWSAEVKINHWFRGQPDPIRSPGDIDPELSVLIGDLGLGYDSPIALDYRRSTEEPSVVTLIWPEDSLDIRWVEVARDMRTFAELIGL